MTKSILMLCVVVAGGSMSGLSWADEAIGVQEGSAKAKPSSVTGFQSALRLGYAVPFGKADGTSHLADYANAIIPIELDIGYRIHRNFFVGIAGQYAFGLLNQDKFFKGCKDCSGRDARVGLILEYYPVPEVSFRPWLGVGTGYEWAHGTWSRINGTYHGFELINLQVGGDYKLAPHFGIGPFASFSVGEFSQFEFLGSSNIDQKALHEWLLLGIRGVYEPD